MMFGGWFSGGGSMAGISGMMVNGGLAYADRWPPMVLPLGLYRAAEEAETEKKRSDWFVKKLMNCYGFDTEAYDKALKEIDNKRDLTDKQCSKLVREAMVKHLKIVIDPEELKELIQEYIDEEASDEHLDIAKASQKELKQIQVVLKE